MEWYNTKKFALTKDNDMFGTITKAEVIKEFISKTYVETDYFKTDKMIALYGEWGSGKTNVLNTIYEELDKNKFNVFWFDTWLYESEKNLSKSLVEIIMNSKKGKTKTELEEAKKKIDRFVTKYMSGITFNLGFMSYDVSSLDDAEGTIENSKSFIERTKEFKINFNKILDIKKMNVVIIDDLDRCNSENVVSILSAIKHFFTLSENIIFIVGIDKSAVTLALENKYGSKIKATEYLEKIFTINFSMPKININSMINSAFGENKEITEFLNSINFTNPRHLKKVLNKYGILTFIKTEMDSEFSNFIPDIIVEKDKSDNEKKTIASILVLYIIILYDFFPQIYYDFKDYDKRIRSYFKRYFILTSGGMKEPFLRNETEYRIKDLSLNNIFNFKSLDIKDEIEVKDLVQFSLTKANLRTSTAVRPIKDLNNFQNLIFLFLFFAPEKSKDLEISKNNNYQIKNISKLLFEYGEDNANLVSYKFAKFITSLIINSEEKFEFTDFNSEYNVDTLFEMAEKFL